MKSTKNQFYDISSGDEKAQQKNLQSKDDEIQKSVEIERNSLSTNLKKVKKYVFVSNEVRKILIYMVMNQSFTISEAAKKNNIG
jgi:hypothetical protein